MPQSPDRWADASTFPVAWDGRTAELAREIRPGSDVIEFGCGRMTLPGFLPEGCTYTASDLFSRGPGTVVCDLNSRPLPPEIQGHDVAVFSGVLEYVHDLPSLVRHLGDGGTREVVASYALNAACPKTGRASGWVNAYTKAELVSLMWAAGYALVSTRRWKAHWLLRFVRA